MTPKEMTPSEWALLQYFYTIASDARVRAAGYSVSKLRDAVLSCVSENLGAVVAFALRGAAARVEAPIRDFARGMAGAAVSGAVSPKAAAEIEGVAEILASDGLRWLGGAIEGKIAEWRKKR